MKQNKTVLLKSAEETFAYGKTVASQIAPGDILCLFGNLGAGKTTLIKGIASGLGIDPDLVFSPTFQLLNIYNAHHVQLCHFDLYRLKNENEFIALGFDEWFTPHTISCIEWAERIEHIIPKHAWRISLEVIESARRMQIEVTT
jgi:tRNA threonylcarbamoyladenosine biosynthesis protein TsaE